MSTWTRQQKILLIAMLLVFIVVIYYYIETKEDKIPTGVLPVEERNSINNSLEGLRK